MQQRFASLLEKVYTSSMYSTSSTLHASHVSATGALTYMRRLLLRHLPLLKIDVLDCDNDEEAQRDREGEGQHKRGPLPGGVVREVLLEVRLDRVVARLAADVVVDFIVLHTRVPKRELLRAA